MIKSNNLLSIDSSESEEEGHHRIIYEEDPTTESIEYSENHQIIEVDPSFVQVQLFDEGPATKRLKISELLEMQRQNCNLKCAQCNLTNEMKLSFECSFCPNDFLSFGQLQEHIFEKHRKLETIIKFERQDDEVGINCCEIFMNSDEKFMCKQMYIFSCSLCQEGFAEFPEFFEHLKKTHLVGVEIIPPPQIFNCDLCDQSFEIEIDLKIHERLHANKNYFQCKNCRQKFTKQKNLIGHKIFCKSGDIEYIIKEPEIEIKLKDIKNEISCDSTTKEEQKYCRICEESISKSIYVDHLRYHQENPYRCRLCKNLYFPKVYNLSRHFAVDHANYKHYKCKHCSFAFLRYTEWKNHVNFDHKIEEEFTSKIGYDEIQITLNENELSEIQNDFFRRACSNSIIITAENEENSFLNETDAIIENNKQSHSLLRTTKIQLAENTSGEFVWLTNNMTSDNSSQGSTNQENVQEEEIYFDETGENIFSPRNHSNASSIDDNKLENDNDNKLENVETFLEGKNLIKQETVELLDQKMTSHLENTTAFDKSVLETFSNKLPYRTNKRVEVISEKPSIKGSAEITVESDCDTCKNGFLDYESMIAHRKTHRKLKFIKCSVCDVIINRNVYLKHFKEHGVKPHKCPDCEETFSTISERDSHFNLHNSNIQILNNEDIIYEEIYCIDEIDEDSSQFIT